MVLKSLLFLPKLHSYSLTYFSSVLRTNLGSRIPNEKKYVIQTSLSAIQTGALCITDAALCNTDEKVYVLRLLEYVCITEKNSMLGNESVLRTLNRFRTLKKKLFVIIIPRF